MEGQAQESFFNKANEPLFRKYFKMCAYDQDPMKAKIGKLRSQETGD